ncbi:MAG TPA: GNAT family protein [Actinomycetales bacterium]|jgi:RimJ/RimL family protein N-acetyltransferase
MPDVRLVEGALVLRGLSASDATAVHDACNDETTRQWLPLPRPYGLDVAMAWCQELSPAIREEGQGLVRAVEVHGRLVACIDAKRLDWVGRTAEVGYWAVPAHRGRGHTTAAVELFSRWLLSEQGFERIELRAAVGNVASQRVAQKAGFLQEGILRNAGYVDQGRVDLVVFSRVRSDLTMP